MSGEQFTARFNREARAVAALNHPHICQLYDVGPDYLVMEYIEGAPLKGPMPVDQALKYAEQICDALDAAHRAGITHRDLKPANILLSKQGIKLLDFGLAKMQPGAEDATLMPLTLTGAVMGTPAYMAPEQWEGKRADARSDIYAFGCLLYEMLTGRQAIKDRAPVEAPLEDIIRTCLAKDPDERWQSARDLKHALHWAVAANSVVRDKAPRKSWPYRSLLAATLISAGIAGTLALIHFREKPPSAQLMRFHVGSPDHTLLAGPAALSPEGRYLAMTASADKQTAIWVRSLETAEMRRLPETEGVASSLVWSPDSRFIAFTVGRRLKRVDLAGGPAQTVCDLDSELRGGAWAPDGSLVISTALGPLRKVPAGGGIPVGLTLNTPGAADKTDINPFFLPDGRHFLYSRGASGATEAGIYIGSLDDKPEQQSSRALLRAEYPNAPVYAPPASGAGRGYLLFAREGSLMAAPFDGRKMQLTGGEVLIAKGFVPGSWSASSTGLLALSGSSVTLVLNWMTGLNQ